MKVSQIKYSLIAILLLCSCKATSADEQLMNKTIKETLSLINKNDYLGVVDKLGNEYEQSDTSNVKFRVNRAYYLLTTCFDNNIELLTWHTDGTLDNLGRMKFIITLFNGLDSLTGYKHAALNLYLGPPEIIPLDKLSGFEVDIELDPEYRGKLLEAGKLLDIEEIVEQLYKEQK